MIALVAPLACASPPDTETEEASATPPASEEPAPVEHEPVDAAALGLEAPFVAEPLPGVVTAGQLTEADLERLAEAGFRTVVNLRTDGENGNWEAAPRASELDLEYVKLPISGAETLTDENAARLAELLADDDKRPMVVHCGSSNRVGALFAVKAFRVDGASLEESLEQGRAAGMTRMEPAVREVLESFE